MTQRAYCDQPHPASDADADWWCEMYHRPQLPRPILPRQTCRKCLRTTVSYTTERIDRRTPAQIQAGRPPAIGVFHTCLTCDG